MTVSTTKAVKTYSGNGVATTFAYDFEIPTTDDVTVYLTLKSTGAITILSASEYSITGIGTATGGVVTYPLSGSPLSALYKITTLRDIAYLQPTQVQNQGNLFADTVELCLDRAVMMIQQLEALYARSLRVPLSDDEVSALVDSSLRANMSLVFDANGNPTVGAISTVAVSAAMTPVVQSATIAAALALLFADAANARSQLGLGGTAALSSDTNRKLRFTNTLARLALTT